MGICGSKEVKEPQSQKVQQRLGTNNSNISNKPNTASSAAPTNKKSQFNNASGGHKLGSKKQGEASTNTTTNDTAGDGAGLTAKEMAAKAAEERYMKDKQKNEKGELGKKLAEKNKKSNKDHALESYSEKKKVDLVYD